MKLQKFIIATIVLFQIETAFAAPRCNEAFFTNSNEVVHAEFESYINSNKDLANFLNSNQKISGAKKATELLPFITSQTEFLMANGLKNPEQTQELAASFNALVAAIEKHKSLKNNIQNRDYENLRSMTYGAERGNFELIEIFSSSSTANATTSTVQAKPRAAQPQEQKVQAAVEPAPVKKSGFFAKVKNLFSSDRYSATEINQQNPHYSEVQINYRRAVRKNAFNEFDSVPSITFVSIRQAQQYIAKAAGQNIVQMTRHEESLLSASQIDSNPHEVGSVILHTTRASYELMSLSGGATEIFISPNQIVRALEMSLSKLKPGEKIVKAELTHVHPTYEVIVNGETVLGSPLSSADLSVASTVSQSLGSIPFGVRAVVPNGYVYERVFVGGQ